MRTVRVLLALLLVSAAPAFARTGQSPDSGSATGGAGGACTGRVALVGSLDGSTALGALAFSSALPSAATKGIYACGTFRMPCTAVGYTQIGMVIGVGVASSQIEVGVFDSAGAARITSTGPLVGTTAGPMTATVTAFTLTSGTKYLACFAESEILTLTARTAHPGGSYFGSTFTSEVFVSGTGATQVAPYNNACTGLTAPYTCCTAANAGTCLGMADRVGVQGITASATASWPVIVIAP